MSNLDMFLPDGGRPRGVSITWAGVALSPSRLPGLDLALNPYSGCGHGCTYCYAPYIVRRDPATWGATASARMNMPTLLDDELRRKRGVIGLGTVTDPYQPAEASLKLTRRCLEMMVKHDARISVLTKSSLVARDADLLSRLDGSEVGITITTMDDTRAAIFEPHASPPSERLRAMRMLHDEGVEVYAFLGPVIPTITDAGLEDLIASVSDSGASTVMVDALALRPGMAERMLSRMNEADPSSLPAFRALLEDGSWYRRTICRVRELCLEAGVGCRDAF